MVYGYVLYHDVRIEPNEKAMRRAINKIGLRYFPGLFQINYADTLGQSNYQRDEKLTKNKISKELYEKIMSENQAVTMKDLCLSGKDLIDLGVEPGKKMGDLLKLMLEDVIDPPEHNNKDYLISNYIKN